VNVIIFETPKLVSWQLNSVVSLNAQCLSKREASCMTIHDFKAMCTEFVNSQSQTTVTWKLILYLPSLNFKALRYKPEEAGSIPDGVPGILH
jgi:hypothetical protein